MKKQQFTLTLTPTDSSLQAQAQTITATVKVNKAEQEENYTIAIEGEYTKGIFKNQEQGAPENFEATAIESNDDQTINAEKVQQIIQAQLLAEQYSHDKYTMKLEQGAAVVEIQEDDDHNPPPPPPPPTPTPTPTPDSQVGDAKYTYTFHSVYYLYDQENRRIAWVASSTDNRTQKSTVNWGVIAIPVPQVTEPQEKTPYLDESGVVRMYEWFQQQDTEFQKRIIKARKASENPGNDEGSDSSDVIFQLDFQNNQLLDARGYLLTPTPAEPQSGSHISSNPTIVYPFGRPLKAYGVPLASGLLLSAGLTALANLTSAHALGAALHLGTQYVSWLTMSAFAVGSVSAPISALVVLGVTALAMTAMYFHRNKNTEGTVAYNVVRVLPNKAMPSFFAEPQQAAQDNSDAGGPTYVPLQQPGIA